MKILYISHYLKMYGANTSLLQLILEMTRKYNVSPFVLIPKGTEEGLIKQLKVMGIPFLQVRMYSWVYKDRKKLCMAFFRSVLNFLQAVRLYFIFRKYDFDLIHSNSSVIDIGIYLKLFLRIPHIWHFREFGYLDYSVKPWIGPDLAKYIYKYGSDKCIAISKAISDYYRLGNKMVVIYNGVDANRYIYTTNEYKNTHVVNFCVVGAIQESKNQLSVIKAFSDIIRNGNYSSLFHLYIIGGGLDSEYGKVLIEYVRDNNLEDMVIFTGFIENVQNLLCKMNIAIVPSKCEGFGRVTIEFMFSGVAVIASNSGANRELVIDEFNGLLYELDNIESLEKCMLLMLNNKSFRKEIVENAYRYAREHYNSYINTDMIFNLYSRINC